MATLTIDFAIDGYPCHLTFDVTASEFTDRLINTVEYITAAGCTPPGVVGATPTTPLTDQPVCKYHGPMKESSKRPGTFFCSHRMGDGSYCKETWPAK